MAELLALFRGGPREGNEFRLHAPPKPGHEMFWAEGGAGRIRHIYRHLGAIDAAGRFLYDYVEPRELGPLLLPDVAWFVWRGEHYLLQRFLNADGYAFDCPNCGQHRALDHAPDAHALSVGPNGALSAEPSVRCDCGWHVQITNGAALDA